MFQHSHYESIEVELSDNITFLRVCRIETHVITKRTTRDPWGFGGIIYIQITEGKGQGGTLWHFSLYIQGCRQFAFNRNYGCSVGQEGANRLDGVSRKSQFEKFIQQSRVPSIVKGLLDMSKKTAAVYIEM